MKPTLLLLAAALLMPACGGAATPADQVSAARAAIQSRDYTEAESLAASASAAATKAGDTATALTADKLRLEALAGQGDGEKVSDELTKAFSAHAGKLDAAFCAKLVGMVDAAGDTLGAIAVLDKGSKQFPGSKDKFEAALAMLTEKAKAASAAGDSAAIERLKALGYL